MKNFTILWVLLALAAISLGSPVTVQAADLTVGDYTLMSETRVARTVYDYTFSATVTNFGSDAEAVKATLTSNDPATTVVDNSLSFGTVAAGKAVTSTDTFTIRQDRSKPFDPTKLSWNVSGQRNIWTAPAPAGMASYTANPSTWSQSGPVADVVAGESYYYVRNDLAAAIISTKKAANNGSGTLHKGAVADMVKRTNNVETLDWTQFILNGSMHNSWNVAAQNLNLDTVSVQNGSVVASGAWAGNAAIQATATYRMLPGAPILKISMVLRNTSAANFTGFFQYQLDPDSSGNQIAYAPGIGWVNNSSDAVRTSGWTGSYIYDGPNTAGSAVPGHGIAWVESKPTGLMVPGYILGAWFNADIPAGGTKTITFYHITDAAASTGNAYDTIAAWASRISEFDDELTGYGLVNGVVTDKATALPIAGVAVVAKNISGQSVASTTTDAAGNYTLNLPLDVYTLTASTLRYEFASKSLNLTAAAPAQQIDLSLAPVTAWAGTGKRLSGSLAEGTADDILMENQQLAMAVAVTFNDPQLPNSTAGKPVDLAVQGLTDAVDWLNLPYLSLTQPRGTEAWQKTTVRNTSVQVVESTAEQAVVKATGTYSEVPGVTVETTYTIKPDQQYITAETVVRNNSGAELTTWIGDVIDNDESGQTSHVPGQGDITTAYASPADYTPSEPWIAMYGSSAQAQGLIYLGGDTDIAAYGNSNWIMSQKLITVANGGTYTLQRLIVAAPTAGYTYKAEAVGDIYRGLVGVDMSLSLSKTKLGAVGEQTTATLTVNNTSDKVLSNCVASLSIPSALEASSALQISLPSIAAHSSTTVSWPLSALAGGKAMVTAKVEKSNLFSGTKSATVFINAPGWYAGDNHTHSIYSDGTGTIAGNYESARNKGLTFVTSTDHNTLNQKNDAYANSTDDFLGLLGEEVTSSYGHSLAYDIASLVDWTLPAQQMVDSARANNNGRGLLYLAHPFYPGLEWDYPEVTGIVGVEVWNGFYAPTDPVNTKAFALWDSYNLEGRRVFGIADSDAHNTSKVGDPHIMAYMDSLSRDEVIRVLGYTGTYYGTNGPELSFTVNGAVMGSDVTVDPAGQVTIALSGSHSQQITSVTLVKNGETLRTWTPAAMTMSATVTDAAQPGDFYRMVVQCQGGGFAYSNPVWIVSSAN